MHTSSPGASGGDLVGDRSDEPRVMQPRT